MRSVLLAVAALLVLAAPASAQGVGVEILDVGGPLDQLAIDFLTDSINESSASIVIIQLDSPGAVSGDIDELIALVGDPLVPVAVWVGPDPAVAHGGALQLLAAASIKAAAPGVKLGYLWPTVAGDRGRETPAEVAERFDGVPPEFIEGRFEVGNEPIPGLVDIVVPSAGQLVTSLDGLTVEAGGFTTELDTAEEIQGDQGPSLRPIVETRFRQPGLIATTLRVATSPEAAFLFVVAGVAVGAFEFYAAGAGLMALAAVLSLLIGGYGFAVLPLRWWAVGATFGGLGLYIADFQRNDLGWKSILGTVSLVAGGVWLTDASPQISPEWWAVVLVVIGTALFFGIGMTAVVRARFSTRTIGREGLVGRQGLAEGPLTPDGVVDVDGARWRARSHRAAGIREGDRVEVSAIDGIVLEVDPVEVDPVDIE
ncbi:MAG: hypothetical protein OEM94_06840 [Acidimicrobiia bacterium]|nr:hypothetical protein [Acidimicrobiia bacterium]